MTRWRSRGSWVFPGVRNCQCLQALQVQCTCTSRASGLCAPSGEVALAFGAGALGKVECGKSECGWHGGDAFGRASTVGTAGASNVEVTAWRARRGAVCGGVRRDGLVWSRPWFCSALRGVPARRTFGIWWGRDQGRDRHSDEGHCPGTSHGRLPGMPRQGNKLDEALERRRTGQRSQTGSPCEDRRDGSRRAWEGWAQSR